MVKKSLWKRILKKQKRAPSGLLTPIPESPPGYTKSFSFSTLDSENAPTSPRKGQGPYSPRSPRSVVKKIETEHSLKAGSGNENIVLDEQREEENDELTNSRQDEIKTKPQEAHEDAENIPPTQQQQNDSFSGGSILRSTPLPTKIRSQTPESMSNSTTSELSSETPKREAAPDEPTPSPTCVSTNLSERLPAIKIHEVKTVSAATSSVGDAVSHSKPEDWALALYDERRELQSDTAYGEAAKQFDEQMKHLTQSVGDALAPNNWWKSSWDPMRYSDFDDGIPRMMNLKKKTLRSESNPDFLALKKEVEKNEFPKEAKRGSSPAPSQEPHEKIEVMPSGSTISSSMPSVGLDLASDLHKTMSISHSSSCDDSIESYESYMSELDLESIGDITIDSETARLIESHKLYVAASQKLKRKRKSCFKVNHMYVDLDTDTILTEKAKKLTWYDDEANLDKPFTLRTDESFDYSVDSRLSSTSENNLVTHILPFAAQIGGMWNKLACGTEMDNMSTS